MMKAGLARTPPTLSLSTKKRWYIARNGRQSGPHDDVEFAAQAGADTIEPCDLVWRPGFLAWVRADEVPGLLIPPPLPEGPARRSDHGEPLRLVVANDPALASPATLVQIQNGPADQDVRPASPTAACQSASLPLAATGGAVMIDAAGSSEALDIPATPAIDASTSCATAAPSATAISATADAAAAADDADGAADLGPNGHTALDGPNFERLRALLDVPDQAAPSMAAPAPRKYASLRSQLKQQGDSIGSKGSPTSRRKRALRATITRGIAGALLGGAAAVGIYVALYGSKTLDVALLWLQVFGVRIL